MGSGGNTRIRSGDSQNLARVVDGRLLVSSTGGGGGGGDVNIIEVGGTPVGGSSVPINDAGGVISIDDAGGSITVDGIIDVTGSTVAVVDPITVDQAVHDDLQCNANVQLGDADIGPANPIPVSNDITGTFTVDQATHDNLQCNANVQFGDVDVTPGNGLPVAQTTHDNLQANANLQVGDADVTGANPVPVTNDGSGTLSVDDGAGTLSVDDGAGSLTVDQATHDNFNANANLQVANADVSDTNPVPVIVLPKKEVLSASSNGRPILIGAALTTIHVVPINEVHCVTIFVSNRLGTDDVLEIDWGTGGVDLRVTAIQSQILVAIPSVVIGGSVAQTIRMKTTRGATVEAIGYFEDNT